ATTPASSPASPGSRWRCSSPGRTAPREPAERGPAAPAGAIDGESRTTDSYREEQPDRAQVDASAGPLVLEFGNDWCGHCQAARPIIAEAFAAHAGIAHLKLADARGKRLGRSFGVKLWPTLVFLRDGRELARRVRPRSVAEVA